eukprot:TRINITY_DN12109_c0_g1_i1.p1 TRINITY_DN12109_c0_g1~~TRINITY_DN12109_c0_g1_i1.p1  ORF type:complete len:346 (-),score=93.51 TRINITY_DN12109_c0_g1_i1:131-1084(-)
MSSNASVKLGANRYGKENVRILRVIKDSPRHEVHELKAQILLEGAFDEAFTTGSNKNIVATETQKNTLYVLAKKYPVDPIEEWAINVSKDMMSRYSQIAAVHMEIDEFLWERIKVGGVEHNHAFKKASNGIRFCATKVTRSGNVEVTGGFKELAVMKTTQSGFEGYIKDEYTTLAETNDRILATKIQCGWSFMESSKDASKSQKGLPFGSGSRYTDIFNRMQNITFEVFAGNPTTGVYSPSVQQTIYDIGTNALKQFPELERISFVLPNIHYYFVDFNQFKTPLKNNKEVFFTFDGAAGHIEGSVERNTGNKTQAKL